MTVRWWEEDADTIVSRLTSGMDTSGLVGRGRYERTPYHGEEISKGIQERQTELGAWGRGLSEEGEEE